MYTCTDVLVQTVYTCTDVLVQTVYTCTDVLVQTVYTCTDVLVQTVYTCTDVHSTDVLCHMSIDDRQHTNVSSQHHLSSDIKIQ